MPEPVGQGAPPVEGLKVPPAEPHPFARNFLRTAVCELRFPTLLEMESKSPVALQGRLRKEYPFYDREQNIRVVPSMSAAVPGSADRHIFRSKDKTWSVAFTPSSIAIETEGGYTNFEAFAARLRRMIESAQDLIDSDFFTRVGLRYINAIPSGARKADLSEWVNPALVADLTTGVYGQVSQYRHELQGICDGGQFTFRHGLQRPDGSEVTEYILDYDFFAEGVPIDGVKDLVKSFNTQCFSFFRWSIGPKTVAALNERVG